MKKLVTILLGLLVFACEDTLTEPEKFIDAGGGNKIAESEKEKHLK